MLYNKKGTATNSLYRYHCYCLGRRPLGGRISRWDGKRDAREGASVEGASICPPRANRASERMRRKREARWRVGDAGLAAKGQGTKVYICRVETGHPAREPRPRLSMFSLPNVTSPRHLRHPPGPAHPVRAAPPKKAINQQNNKNAEHTVIRFLVMMSVPAVTLGFSALSFFVACCTICSTERAAEGRSTAMGGRMGAMGLARQIRVYARENQRVQGWSRLPPRRRGRGGISTARS